MSTKKLLKEPPQGKTGWEHLKSWWRGDSKAPPMKDVLRSRYNPLNLSIGDMVELRTPKPEAYEVEAILCFEPEDGGGRATRYEFKETYPTVALEILEDSSGPLYTLYELDDEFDVDHSLIEVCEQDDYLERTKEEVRQKFNKDIEQRARVLVVDRTHTERIDMYGFYYSSDDGQRFVTVEVWPDSQWMRIYMGRNLRATEVKALGTR